MCLGEWHSLLGVIVLLDSNALANFYKCEHLNQAAAAMVTGWILELGDWSRQEIRWLLRGSFWIVLVFGSSPVRTDFAQVPQDAGSLCFPLSGKGSLSLLPSTQNYINYLLTIHINIFNQCHIIRNKDFWNIQHWTKQLYNNKVYVKEQRSLKETSNLDWIYSNKRLVYWEHWVICTSESPMISSY